MQKSLIEYPFESLFASVDGYRMHYIDEVPAVKPSSGTVVLLHGNPTWSYFFRHLVIELREHFRVIAPDWIGCGLSDHPKDAHFRADDRIRQLQELLAQLKVDRLALVMHDWGGPIGTGFAVRNIERIERLVYLNTTLTETESLPLIIKNAARPILGKFLTKYSANFVNMTTGFGVVHPLSREVRAAYASPYRSSARRTAIWDFVADIPFNDQHPSYASMLEMAERLPLLRSVPVQIIWGLKDPCFHREMLSKVAQHFPHAAVLEIANASHLVLEDAAKLANSTIRSFLLGEGSTEARIVGTGQPLVASLYPSLAAATKSAPLRRACVEPRFPIDISAPGATVDYRQISFRDLRTLIHKYERGLRELGVVPGDRILMLVSPGSEFIALSYAVLGRGAVPVFLDPGMGREKLLKCIEECAPQALIGSPRAMLLRWLAPKIFKSFKFRLAVSEWPLPWVTNLSFLKRFSSLPVPPVPCAPDAPGLIAFTSGATGVPKGVIFTHRMLAAQLEIFANYFGISAPVVTEQESDQVIDNDGLARSGQLDLPLLPIFSLFTVALGIGSAFPPVDPAKPLNLDPQKVVRVIRDLGVSSSFGSPTLWNKIAEYCVRSATLLPSIRRVFMAGAPVPVATIHRVRDILPEGEAYTPYGATEALPVTHLSASEIVNREAKGTLLTPASGGEIGTLVGRSVKGIELKIIQRIDGAIADISQVKELAPGEIGEVIVRGENVSSAYLHRPEATIASKIADGAGGTWHRMGDVGYIDSDSNLYFCGRVAHVVQTYRTLFSIPSERIFNEHPQVRRSALVYLASTKEAAIVIEPHPQFWPESPESRQRFEEELTILARSSPITEGIRSIFFHKAFPVDARHNAKIFRDQLGVWADSGSGLRKAA